MAKRKNSKSQPASSKPSTAQQLKDSARDKDILWRSVRIKTEPLKLGVDAFNQHAIQHWDLAKTEPKYKEPSQGSKGSIQKVDQTYQSYSLATWQIGEKAKAKARAETFAKNASVQKKEDLEAGRLADLDRATADKFKRGKLAVEARLDLHGFTQDQAKLQLTRFIDQAYSRGQRCVIVVTGKGDPRQGGGVLKRNVPQWLNAADTRYKILALSQAQPKDGGSGALYVLIKRRRV